MGAGANISACTVLILGRVFPTENSVQAENTEFTTIRETILISMGNSLFVALFALIASSFHTRAALQAEILALRHQLAVLQANAPRHLRLKRSDRVLWLFLSRFWSLANWYGAKIQRNVTLLQRSKTTIRQPQVPKVKPKLDL